MPRKLHPNKVYSERRIKNQTSKTYLSEKTVTKRSAENTKYYTRFYNTQKHPNCATSHKNYFSPLRNKIPPAVQQGESKNLSFLIFFHLPTVSTATGGHIKSVVTTFLVFSYAPFRAIQSKSSVTLEMLILPPICAGEPEELIDSSGDPLLEM